MNSNIIYYSSNKKRSCHAFKMKTHKAEALISFLSGFLHPLTNASDRHLCKGNTRVIRKVRILAKKGTLDFSHFGHTPRLTFQRKAMWIDRPARELYSIKVRYSVQICTDCVTYVSGMHGCGSSWQVIPSTFDLVVPLINWEYAGYPSPKVSTKSVGTWRGVIHNPVLDHRPKISILSYF